MEAKRESTDFYEGHLPTMTANDKISYLTTVPLGHVGKVDTSQQVIMCSSIDTVKGVVRISGINDDDVEKLKISKNCVFMSGGILL